MKKSSLRSVAELSEFIESGEFHYAAQFIKPVDPGIPVERWYGWLIRPQLDDPNVTAQDFVNAVESSELSLDLDMRAARDALIWLEQQEINTVLTIGVSSATFANRHYIQHIVTRIEESDIQPDQLCFDIGVHDALGDLSSATRFVKSMHRLGCRIVLHDGVPGNPVLGLFGPLGFIDYLRIERKWVGPAPESRAHRKTLEDLVDYGKRLKLKLIAEGVDNQHHLDLVRELNVDFYQGVLDGEPPVIAGVRDDQLIFDQRIA